MSLSAGSASRLDPWSKTWSSPRGDAQRSRRRAIQTCPSRPIRATWLRIDSGSITGLEAFAQRRLTIRGSIEKSLQFETMFDRATRAEPGYALERVSLGGVHISALTMGEPGAEPLVLLHGLGASKASWLPVVPQLAAHYRVIVPDLPGFGASSKPRGSYDAGFFSDHVFRLMDMLAVPSALVAGNSLGGRVAMEMAMAQPDRVHGIVCLCPAAAFSRRPFLRLVRIARPELGIMASRIPPRAGARRALRACSRLPIGWPITGTTRRSTISSRSGKAPARAWRSSPPRGTSTSMSPKGTRDSGRASA